MRKKITKKSANTRGNYITYACGQDYINLSRDITPSSLLYHNKNYVNACISKITQYLSSVPIHLYYYSKSSKKLLSNTRTLSKSLVNDLRKNNRIEKKAMDIVEIEESHPVLDLMDKPQLDMSYVDWIALIQTYISLMGNCLLEIVEDNGEIQELKIIKWEDVEVTIDNKAQTIVNYIDRITQRIYSPEQVIHLKSLDAGSTLIGRGKLESCLDSSSLYNYYDQYQINLSKNYGSPGVFLTVKNKISNKDEAKKIAEEFQSKFARGNVGKPMISFGDVDVKTISTTPKDMEYAEGRKASMNVICSIFGVPIDLISTDNSNRASSQTAMSQFMSYTILPLLDKILEQINTKVVGKYYDENLWLWYDKNEVIEKDPKLQADILNSYIASGIISVNEARKILGYEEIEEIEGTDTTEVRE